MDYQSNKHRAGLRIETLRARNLLKPRNHETKPVKVKDLIEQLQKHDPEKDNTRNGDCEYGGTVRDRLLNDIHDDYNRLYVVEYM
jgi:hypothetical protein